MFMSVWAGFINGCKLVQGYDWVNILKILTGVGLKKSPVVRVRWLRSGNASNNNNAYNVNTDGSINNNNNVNNSNGVRPDFSFARK